LNQQTFDTLGLVAELVRAVHDEGYTVPTPVQAQAIPFILAGRDVLAGAQTGTGKTAGFTLPMLQRLAGHTHHGGRHAVRALVVTPTRELAAQIEESIRTYGKYMSLRSALVFGGVGMQPQVDALRRGVDILVATPGRLLDHVGQKTVNLSHIEILVLDEADRMLDMGFAPDVNRILDSLPGKRQTMLFSATISGDVDRLARRAMQDHAAVEIGRRAEVAEGVQHVLVAVDKAAKRDALARMLLEMPGGRTLVFTRTKYGADKLAHHLRREGGSVAAMHGGKTQSSRNKALDAFREGRTRVLVATDVAARGIDVDDIALVVNYDVPQDPEVYVHRVGRTARAGAQGIAVTLMSPDEWLMMRDVEKLMGRTFPRQVIEGYEPSVAPLQPEDRAAAPRRQGPSVRPRNGRSRRR